jgi:hypothetical protein
MVDMLQKILLYLLALLGYISLGAGMENPNSMLARTDASNMELLACQASEHADSQ